MAVVLAGCGGSAVGDGKAVKPVAVQSTASPSPSAAAKAGLELVDDEASGQQGGKQIIVAALANDSVSGVGGEDGDVARAVGAGTYALSVSVKPRHGTAVVSGTNLVYTATGGYAGADEFTYQVAGTGKGAGAGAGAVSDTAVVRITVSAPVPVSTPTAPSVPKPRKTVKPAKPAVEYANCSAVRAAGAAPIRRGEPGYGRHLDRDGDGVGCEASSGGSGSSSGGTTGGSGSSGGGGSSTYYKNCSAVRAAGAAPIRRGDPGYARHLDRDGDGVGCE
jgi:uncharacterized membrane protein YgcG